MENPIKMDDLGVPLFSETSICGYIDLIPITISYFTDISWTRLPQFSNVGLPWIHSLPVLPPEVPWSKHAKVFKEPTPPKINMEPDKCSRKEKETHLQTTLFFGFLAIFFRAVFLLEAIGKQKFNTISCLVLIYPMAESENITWPVTKKILAGYCLYIGELTQGR